MPCPPLITGWLLAWTSASTSRSRSSTSHRHLLHDLVFDDGKPWMLMRLVTGHSLLEPLDRRGPLSVAEATRAARHPLSALQAAHREESIVRDVKPANVSGQRPVLPGCHPLPGCRGVSPFRRDSRTATLTAS
ncbi:hypothetical protein AQJ11_35195 [Streptomyces corchorusii]|uniref:Protein kinase domain-containing protein n=1 Tax=Streptomyces corchorusii TaxID=1903 RepID=A0A117QAX4_STRCK|nr:hypothetical protein AQJ11_35195 [Streptomyces corchorusii]